MDALPYAAPLRFLGMGLLVLAIAMLGCSSRGESPGTEVEKGPTVSVAEVLASTSGAGPEANVREFPRPGGITTSSGRIAPDETLVVIRTVGGRIGFPKLLVYDAGMNLLGSERRLCRDMAFGDRENELLVGGMWDLHCLSVPDLNPVMEPGDLEKSTGLTALELGGGGVHELRWSSSRDCWFAVGPWGRDGVVEILRGEHLSLGRKVRFGEGFASGEGYVHDVSEEYGPGRLALLLAPNVIEVFDIHAMSVIKRLTLPCQAVRYDIAVVDGVAFFATGAARSEGDILGVDLESGAVVETIAGGGKSPCFAVSRSGSSMAVVARGDCVDGKAELSMRVLLRIDGRWVQESSATARARVEVCDVAIAERSRTVVICGPTSLVWKY